jgi:hypothetical protein
MLTLLEREEEDDFGKRQGTIAPRRRQKETNRQVPPPLGRRRDRSVQSALYSRDRGRGRVRFLNAKREPRNDIYIVNTTLNLTLPLIIWLYASSTFASGYFSIIGRTPVSALNRKVSSES